MEQQMQADHLACRLLKLEQQIKAYERLHAGELAELWQTLNECKQGIAEFVSFNEPAGAEEPMDSDTRTSPLESTAATRRL